MYTDMTLFNTDTRQCFQDFLGELLLAHGEGEVPDFALKENDRPDKCDRNALYVDICRDVVELRRPFPQIHGLIDHLVERVSLPYLLTKKPDQGVVSITDAMSGLLQRLYPSHQKIHRLKLDHDNRFGRDVVNYATFRNELRASFYRLEKEPTAKAIRIAITSSGMVSITVMGSRGIPISEYTRRFTFQ